MQQESKKIRSTCVPAENTNWLQRLGIAGFIFFLAKGLVWIVAAAWLVY